MGPLGVPELILLFIIALLVFGPKRLPELGRTVGKAMNEFRRASNELKSVVEDEVREMERQTADVKRQAEDAVSYPDDMHTSASPASEAAPPEPAASVARGAIGPEEKEKAAHGEPGTL